MLASRVHSCSTARVSYKFQVCASPGLHSRASPQSALRPFGQEARRCEATETAQDSAGVRKKVEACPVLQETQEHRRASQRVVWGLTPTEQTSPLSVKTGIGWKVHRGNVPEQRAAVLL